MTKTPSDIDLNLTGKLLIATPAMGDPRFERSVIVVCSHDEKGALGLVINTPHPSLGLSEVLAGMDLLPPKKHLMDTVIMGGPVQTECGFVLHSTERFKSPGSLIITDSLAMTTTKDVLMALGGEHAPQKALLALGYAGWGEQQLEAELADNAWLLADCTGALVFDTPPEEIWTAALASLGIKPEMLSNISGRA